MEWVVFFVFFAGIAGGYALGRNSCGWYWDFEYHPDPDPTVAEQEELPENVIRFRRAA